jgi:uncharacterized protein (DUF924 family)
MKSISNGKEKERREWFWKKYFKEKLDTIVVDPHNKHTIEDQGCSWTTSLKNCLAACVLLVLIRHHIFREIWHSWELQKVKEKIAKERVTGMFENLSPQAEAGHNSEPVQQTYCWGSILPMDYFL